MRSTFNGLNTMVRGIFSNQMSLDTVGHNITNASTEGYSRQRVDLAATICQVQGTLYGDVAVGTGVDALSVTRARNIFADKQYRQETATQNYYEVLQRNYDKLEAVMNDSDDQGVLDAITNFYQGWVDLSTKTSAADARKAVVSQGIVLSDIIQTVTSELEYQIRENYEELKVQIDQINDITSQLVDMNKQIIAQQAGGASANDLKDQRDLLVDQLASFVDVNIIEDSTGSYTIVSNGVTLVNETARLTLGFSPYSSNIYGADYGIEEYMINIQETQTAFVPLNGALKGQLDVIEENKRYIDHMADLASFFLTTFNEQHAAGKDQDDDMGENFFGNKDVIYVYGYDSKWSISYVERYNADGVPCDATGNELTGSFTIDDYRLTGVQIIEAMEVNSSLEDDNKVATKLAELDENGDVQYEEENGLIKAKDDGSITSTPGTKLYLDLSAKTANTAADGSGTSYSLTDDQINILLDSAIITGSESDHNNAVHLSNFFNMSPATWSGIVTSSERWQSLTTIANFIESRTEKPINTTLPESSPMYLDDNKKINKLYIDGGTQTSPGCFINGLNAPITGYNNQIVNKFSVNTYYVSTASQLAIYAESVDVKVSEQESIITQIQNWRDSEMGVDWNEELTNMIKFQKGFGACSRCLSAMDEMLDRLINSTGQVGR